MVKLDLKDKKILYELDKNSRASLKEISKKTRVSKEVVFHRINRLIEEDVIIKFLTVPATYRLGLTGYKVYLRLINTSKEDLNKITNHLKKEKSVYYTSVCKGRWDLIFGIWAKSTPDFFTIYNKMLDKFSKYIQEKESPEVKSKNSDEKSSSRLVISLIFNVLFFIWFWVYLLFMLLGLFIYSFAIIISGAAIFGFTIFALLSHNNPLTRSVLFSGLFAGLGILILGDLFMRLSKWVIKLFFKLTKQYVELNNRFIRK